MAEHASMDFHTSSNAFHGTDQSHSGISPLQPDALDLDGFLLAQGQVSGGTSTSDQHLDSEHKPDFGDFNFPLQAMSDGTGAEGSIDARQDLHNEGFHQSVSGAGSEHRGSISSTMQPRASIGSGAAIGGLQMTNADDSDGASPSSNQHDGLGGNERQGDDGMNGNRHTGDGNDGAGKAKDDKNGRPPPWSELKTKAGKERKRLPLACIACRRKKIRCSGEKPACKHCLRSRIPCVYKVTTRKAAPRTDYMAMLDKRLKRMEERILKIVPKEDVETNKVTRAVVKPTIPNTMIPRASTGRKRGADEAFGQELDTWAKLAITGNVPAPEKPPTLLIQEAEESKLLLEGADSLPSREVQEHLAEVFFENIYGQTYHVLHKPSFMKKLRAGELPPVLILSVCAVSARFSTHPKLNTSPAFLRGEQWASEARDIVMRRYDWPNITILSCLLILGLHEFGTCQGGRSWSLGGMAIRMAFALQLHKDLVHDPMKQNNGAELSFIDREIRRRTMWACFLMDRFNSSGTDRPTFIKEATMKIQLPINEKNFQLDIPGYTEDLNGKVPEMNTEDTGELLDPKSNMGVAAYMNKCIAIWGRIINYLNLGGKEQDSYPIWSPESQCAKLSKETEEFIMTLPDNLKYNSENLHMHETDAMANHFLFLHISAQQNILFLNRFAVPRLPGGRTPREVPQEFATKAAAKAVMSANRISMLLKDAESYFVTAPFTGYCAFLSSTVHIYGVFSKNTNIETTAKTNLATNIRYLTKMKRYWGMFHFMAENLKDQYRTCADAVRQGKGANQLSSTIFQYGDWFDRYPHGVSESDFEEAAAGVKKEKGDDAVLEQKSTYSTVEDFFRSLSPSAAPEAQAPPKHPRRKSTVKKEAPPQAQPDNQQQPATNLAEPVINVQNAATPITPSFPHMGPNTGNMYAQPQAQGGFYSQDLLPPYQQSMLPQLDRQLVFSAYGTHVDPMSMSTGQHMMGGNMNTWGMGVNGGMGPGFVTEPTSAWFMPFNMEPPEIGQDTDAMGNIVPMGLGTGNFDMAGLQQGQQAHDGNNNTHGMPGPNM